MSDEIAFIFEVSNKNFNSTVVLNSYKLPVITEFMGIWSGPCIQTADTLSMLATEFKGKFIFAKVDIDEQPELKETYNVENVPTLKVFKDGEVVRTEEGHLNEVELRALLKDYGVFRQSDANRELARQQHMAGNTMEAITLLTNSIKEDPTNTRLAMDMVQIFLDINELEQAKGLFDRLPEREKQSEMGKALVGQLTFRELAAKTDGKEQLQARVTENKDDYDALFDLSICLIAEHNYSNAVDSLFVIFEQDPDYKDGAVKEMIINLSNMLATNEPTLSQEVRRRLGSSLS